MKPENGQIGIFDDMNNIVFAGCGDCICRKCLYYWSQRCPYGGCTDDFRAKFRPWPGQVRKSWANWNLPGEQAHWCRGGTCYTAQDCDHYVRYEKDRHIMKDCLDAVVDVFQDGYIRCSLVNNVGCEECYRRFEERMNGE